MRFIKNGKLNDRRIVATLHQAAKDYENGELLEVRDTLAGIAGAIDEFTENCESFEQNSKTGRKNNV